MKVELIRIGNSRGVRLPKSVIDQCGFESSIELQVEDGYVILARDRQPRDGWKEALDAVKNSIANDEMLLDGIPEHEFDHDEWTW